MAAEPAFDAAQAWERFLAKGDITKAFAAFDVLDKVGYDAVNVDAAQCGRQQQALRKAAQDAPVSIAIRRAAFLCAQAVGDDAGAERELAVLAALSRHALASTGEPGVSKPIRILAPVDAVALLVTGGLRTSYFYYGQLWPKGSLPQFAAAWDPETQTERHYAFDVIDTIYTLDRQNAIHGNVALRNSYALNLVNRWAEAGEVSDLDLAATRAAHEAPDPRGKLAALKPAAQKGGLLSLSTWLTLCDQRPFDGCADDLVEPLLAGAERGEAYPTLLLALIHARGIGVARDEAAAMKLLDRADAIWPSGAVGQYAVYWEMLGTPYPAALQTRLERMQAHGSRMPRRLAIHRKVDEAKAELSADEIAFLADPAENGNGLGFAMLASYYQGRGEAAERRRWLEKAAAAGSARAQEELGWQLFYGEAATRDPERGGRLISEAAQSGRTWAMRHMAEQERLAGRWKSAGMWLFAAVQGDDVDAAFDLIDIFMLDMPEIGTSKDAVATLRSLSDTYDSARARRQLAELALEGVGMPKDPAQAERWLLVDAEKGDHQSQAQLAMGYFYGHFGAIDEAKGQQWIQPALEGKEERAFTGYAGWLYHRKRTPESRAEAVALWNRSIEAGQTAAYNELAWASCTSPYPDVFDAQRGLATVEKMGDPAVLDLPEQDTVAACYAAGGRFAQAIDLQSKAIEQLDVLARANKARFKPMADDFRVRLALYRKGRVYLSRDEDEVAGP
ncbi:sel1 repeat family protein [Lysobacter sp. OAE881]|uniref:sel1 repeat family protein n=1 Tax=Lysobacter sp. OAE881 TaxID=2663813 RepID=UPI001789B184